MSKVDLYCDITDIIMSKKELIMIVLGCIVFGFVLGKLL